MTDRYFALTVTLERDTRDDDCEPIINAIRMVRGVADVTPHVADLQLHAAEDRAKRDLEARLLAALRAPRAGGS